jgi:hypothetical protein
VNTNALQSHVDRLDDALVLWEDRDDTKPQPLVRQAANTAVHAIDALLGELHRMRADLLDQIRVSDDTSAARVDALLRERSVR